MITYRQPFEGEYPITQHYGELIPGVTANGKPHTGIDYGCPEGTPILASAKGVVKCASFNSYGWGNMIIISHPDGKATVYAHLARMRVAIGQPVEQGYCIGYSGHTGNVVPPGEAGAHLHFEARADWWNGGSHRDPVTFLPLMTVDDAIAGKEPEGHPDIPEGVCRVACDTAFVRDWSSLERQYPLHRGDRVYAFVDRKYLDGIPFRFIGGNRCMAEYDWDGTQILEVFDGEE